MGQIMLQWSAFYLPIISQLWLTVLNHDGRLGLCKLHFSVASLLPIGFLPLQPLGGIWEVRERTSVSSFFIPPAANDNYRFILQLLLAFPAPALLLLLPGTSFWALHSR